MSKQSFTLVTRLVSDQITIVLINCYQELKNILLLSTLYFSGKDVK